MMKGEWSNMAKNIEGREEYTLGKLEKQIARYPSNINKLERSKHIVVKLSKKRKQIDLCVLSNVMLGMTGAHFNTAKEDKPFRIQKFKAHIEELANNPDAQVVLGGDLFYFPGGKASYRETYSPSYEDQVEMMTQLLLPIKDKIICAYDGTEEIKIFEKDGFNLTKKLMQGLGLGKRYCGQMAEVDFVFNNKLTKGTTQTVHMLFDHGFLTANGTASVAKKTEDLQNKIDGKDFYFTSHYNKLFIERRASLVADNDRHMVKRPYYFVSVGGYRDYPNRASSNRNVSAANTDNGMIRVFVVPNPDEKNVRGQGNVGEPTFKICQEFKNFGRTPGTELDFDLMKEIAKINAENTYTKILLTEAIEEKFKEVNDGNVAHILAKHYQKQNQAENNVAGEDKILIKNSDPIVIDLDDEEEL